MKGGRESSEIDVPEIVKDVRILYIGNAVGDVAILATVLNGGPCHGAGPERDLTRGRGVGIRSADTMIERAWAKSEAVSLAGRVRVSRRVKESRFL